MNRMQSYCRDIWKYRYLAHHLAASDLRARFRGSYVGALWLLINPLIFTAIFSLIFGTIFSIPLKEYAPYVLIGVVLWEFIAGVTSMSTQSIINAEGYLKQSRIPQIVFCIRTIFYLLICFIVSFVSVFAVCYIFIDNFNIFSTLFILILITPILLFFTIPIGIIGAVANTRFRDYQQALGHIIMVLYYMSPVFIARAEFERPQLKSFSDYNPITSLLDIFRDPILYGKMIDLHDVAVVVVWGLLFWCIAIYALIKTERDTIFYF